MPNFSEQELIRVFYPGVVITDVVDEYIGTYSNTVTVQDMIDAGILYMLQGPDGNSLICAALAYGKATASLVINSTAIKPIPIPTLEFVGGRPDVRR